MTIYIMMLQVNKLVIHRFSIFFFFFIQFNVPFKIISLKETSQSIGGRNGRTPGKPPDTPASRTWLVSHVDGFSTILICQLMELCFSN